jgi:hypothetical protein
LPGGEEDVGPAAGPDPGAPTAPDSCRVVAFFVLYLPIFVLKEENINSKKKRKRKNNT